MPKVPGYIIYISFFGIIIIDCPLPLLHHLLGALPSSNLLLTQLPQLLYGRGAPSHHTLRDLRNSPDDVLSRDRISRRLSLDSDNANSGILRSTIMFPITEIAQPCFKCRGIVFLDNGTVGYDARDARHRGPFAGGVEEGDVDVWVGIDVVGLAGFGVGVED